MFPKLIQNIAQNLLHVNWEKCACAKGISNIQICHMSSGGFASFNQDINNESVEKKEKQHEIMSNVRKFAYTIPKYSDENKLQQADDEYCINNQTLSLQAIQKSETRIMQKLQNLTKKKYGYLKNSVNVSPSCNEDSPICKKDVKQTINQLISNREVVLPGNYLDKPGSMDWVWLKKKEICKRPPEVDSCNKMPYAKCPKEKEPPCEHPEKKLDYATIMLENMKSKRKKK